MLASACKIMLRDFGSDDLIQALAALADPAWSPPPAESPPPASDPKKRKADDHDRQGPSGSRPQTALISSPKLTCSQSHLLRTRQTQTSMLILSQALQSACLDSADQSQSIVDWSGSTLVDYRGDHERSPAESLMPGMIPALYHRSEYNTPLMPFASITYSDIIYIERLTLKPTNGSTAPAVPRLSTCKHSLSTYVKPIGHHPLIPRRPRPLADKLLGARSVPKQISPSILPVKGPAFPRIGTARVFCLLFWSFRRGCCKTNTTMFDRHLLLRANVLRLAIDEGKIRQHVK